MKAFLPDPTRISQVHLRTANLKRALAFYSGVLGFRAVCGPGPQAVLSAGGEPGLILLSEEPDAVPRPPRSTGLSHLGLRYPGRKDLARAYVRLVNHPHPVERVCNHGVCEAIYLKDPDGNGLELYADRPRRQSRARAEELTLVNRPLDLGVLLATVAGEPVADGPPAGTEIGHIQFHVADLAVAERFYGEFLGLAVTQRSCPGALYFATGRRHHQIAADIWAGTTAPPPGSAGLVSYRVEVPVAEILYCLNHRAPLHGCETRSVNSERGSRVLQIRDPNGTWLEVQAAPAPVASTPAEEPFAEGSGTAERKVIALPR